MGKKANRSATNESAVKRDLRTPLYRMRVVKDKTKYDRSRMKRFTPEGFRKIVEQVIFRKPSSFQKPFSFSANTP